MREVDHAVRVSRSRVPFVLWLLLCALLRRKPWFGVRWRVQHSWEKWQGTAPSSPSCNFSFLFLGSALCQPICMEAWCLFLRLSTLSTRPALRTCTWGVFSLQRSPSREVDTTVL